MDAPLLMQWVDRRIDLPARAAGRSEQVEHLRRRLHAAWSGCRVEIGWVHGDFWLGDVVAQLLARPTWAPAERELLHAAGAETEAGVDPDVLLLVWLRQVAANLGQAPGLAHNPVWVRRNIASVLRVIDAGLPEPSRPDAGSRWQARPVRPPRPALRTPG